MVFVLAGWFVGLRPTNLGGPMTYLLVRGSSMLPTYSGGDFVILRQEASYQVGDAVTYRVPAGEIGAGHLVLHRIVGGSASEGFDLQGDNNDALDPWHPRASDIAGKVWLAVPAVGRAIAVLRQPIILGALAASVVVGWFVATTGSAGTMGAAASSGATGLKRMREGRPAVGT